MPTDKSLNGSVVMLWALKYITHYRIRNSTSCNYLIVISHHSYVPFCFISSLSASYCWTCACTVAPAPLFKRIHPGHCIVTGWQTMPTSSLTFRKVWTTSTWKLVYSRVHSVDNTNRLYYQGCVQREVKLKQRENTRRYEHLRLNWGAAQTQWLKIAKRYIS